LRQIPLKATLEGIEFSDLMAYMRFDKKVVDETIRFVLPLTIGRVEIVTDVSPKQIATALSYLQALGWSFPER
jgi:3-dehydroquinate synthetase